MSPKPGSGEPSVPEGNQPPRDPGSWLHKGARAGLGYTQNLKIKPGERPGAFLVKLKLGMSSVSSNSTLFPFHSHGWQTWPAALQRLWLFQGRVVAEK